MAPKQLLLLMAFTYNQGTPFCRFMQIKQFYSISYSWLIILILMANLLLSLMIKTASKKIAMYIDEHFPVVSKHAADKAREFKLLFDISSAASDQRTNSITRV